LNWTDVSSIVMETLDILVSCEKKTNLLSVH
jgi:hypothetical protein